MAKIIFTVTNDLSYDQRMQRICNSLAKENNEILLVGRFLKKSVQLKTKLFRQKRITCFFNAKLIFYAEYNIRLFFFLLFQKVDIICAIDLDTILPCYFVSLLKNKKRVYDAHELFTEQKEIITRPFIQTIWKWIEKFAVPKFKMGYTVNEFIKTEFKKNYEVEYDVIRNLPTKINLTPNHSSNNYIIYQGAVNEGRCFETLIPAMKNINSKLIICGNGNFFEAVTKLIIQNNVADKIILKDYVLPKILQQLTPQSYIGITLFEPIGKNQYYSLSNRFFDYMMAGIPQICVNYPEYKKINDEFEIALLVENTKTKTIEIALNNLLNNSVLYERLKQNCLKAREQLNWNYEEIKLKKFWKNICTSFH